MAKGQSIVKLTLESQQYERNLKQAQRQFNEFVKGIGLNVPKISAMTAAIGATSAALKVAKDSFFKNEQNLDEWAKVVKSSESIYAGFLNSINNGDISGFLSNIDSISKAAREAYDALDQLATFNAFNQVNVQRTRTNMTESIVEFREGNLGKDEVRKSAEAYKKELKKRRDLEEIAYKKEINRVAKERGISGSALYRVLSGSSENYDRLKATKPTGTRIGYVTGGMFGGTVSYTEKFPQTATEKMGDALRKLNDTELDHLQSLGAQAQRTGEEIAQTDKMLSRILRGRGNGNSNSGGGRGGGGGGRGGGRTTIEKTETQLNNEKIDALAKSYEKASEERRESIRKEIAALQKRNEEIQKYYDIATGKVRTPTGDGKVSQLVTGPTGFATSPLTIGTLNTSRSMSELETMISGLRTMQAGSRTNAEYEGFEKSIKPLQKRLDQITGEDKKKKNEDITLSEGVGMMVSGVSNMASGLEQLGIKVPEGMQNVIGKLQAITTILTAIETMQKVGTFLGFWHTGGVARAAGGLNVVPGNWGHDMVPALLQSGEVVLNRAQQGNLSAQLANNYASMQLTATLRGEDIQLSINNRSRRRGRGEYVTSKFR